MATLKQIEDETHAMRAEFEALKQMILPVIRMFDGGVPMTCQLEEQRVKVIDAQVQDIQKVVKGNGKPGLEVRLDRLERAMETQTKIVWVALAVVVGQVVVEVFKISF